MRALPRFVLLFPAFLSAGCFTQSHLSRDEPPPDDRTVAFHLQDGTTVISTSGKHHRIEEGYEVIGMVSQQTGPEARYEGIIRDDDLIGITMQRYDPAGTMALITGVGITLLLILNRWGQGGP